MQLMLCRQVFTQPWFAFVESTTYKYIPKSFFTHKEFVIRIPGIGALRLTLFRLIWRTLYVCFTTGNFATHSTCWHPQNVIFGSTCIDAIVTVWLAALLKGLHNNCLRSRLRVVKE